MPKFNIYATALLSCIIGRLNFAYIFVVQTPYSHPNFDKY